MTDVTRALLSFVCVTALVCGVAGSGLVDPELEVLSHNLTTEVVKNEAHEDDWAYIYTINVRNVGQAGKVRAKGRITTPQGQFYREETVAFAADEAKVIRFVYTEPIFIIDMLKPEARSKYEFSYDVIR